MHTSLLTIRDASSAETQPFGCAPYPRTANPASSKRKHARPKRRSIEQAFPGELLLRIAFARSRGSDELHAPQAGAQKSPKVPRARYVLNRSSASGSDPPACRSEG